MHIMEGYLPIAHAVGWSVVAAPFVVHGVRALSTRIREQPESRLLLGACGGFVFVLSALRLPSVTGSCSHPTGIGLGAVLLGPSIMSVLGLAVLLFQALFLAHGGLTTLGANVFSMAVVGAYVASGLFKACTRLRLPINLTLLLAASLADLATYAVTSLQLAFAFPDPASGFVGSTIKFLGIFAITQLPLAATEGLITVLVINLLRNHAGDVLSRIIPTAKARGR